MIRGLFLVVALAAPTFQLVPSQLYAVNSNATQRTKRNATGSQQCGKVHNSPVPLSIGAKAPEGQWPWHVALYQTQKVDNKYVCGGTLVSPRHVITAAHCVVRRNSNTPVDKNTLTVHLGKQNLKTSYEGVQLRLVEKITVNPEFDKSTYNHNAAIIELKEPVPFTNWVQPICLWPENQEDLSTILGKEGSVVGWGFDETGEPSEELKLVEMPVVSHETCIRSYSDFYVRFTSNYTYCAGNKPDVFLCNGDSGGGMVFRNGDTWYLRGLVSLSVARQGESRCDPKHYVIFTDIAKILPWVKQIVDNP